MVSELSGIFRVKPVTKNIVRGSPGTQFMHMRVKKETLAQAFSCEFFEISKSTFFTEHLWATACMLPFLYFLKNEEFIHFFFNV